MFDPTTLGAALSSAKTILDLMKNAKDAQLAIKISSEIANLQGRLIDVQQQVFGLQEENQKLREEARELKAKLADVAEMEACPKCRKKAWHVESSRPDPDLGDLGVSLRIYKCDSCGFSENRASTFNA
jgi:regulator of replication initiation timing